METPGASKERLSINSFPEVQPIRRLGNILAWGGRAGVVVAAILLWKADGGAEVAVAGGALGGSLLITYLASFLQNPDKLVDLLDDD